MFNQLLIQKFCDPKRLMILMKIRTKRGFYEIEKMQQKTMSTLMPEKALSAPNCKNALDENSAVIKSRWSKKKFEDIEKIANQQIMKD